jgi:hypothetical protein
LIYLAIIAALAIAALVYEKRQNSIDKKEWALERGALLTRIQHPEFVVAAPEQPVTPDEELLTSEPDDIDLVGTISTGTDNGDSPSD